ncbi:U2 small nuclear ribonucleoprotein auxiliary factor 35 kDa subunit-related protein 2 [Episyrphus balteatus]|uniref:U2 small nuclear ribonucleoprotein auxiliary factor 35 kDa subunit-related protein 2 n=1 Tax=Episyrphus balteatus TaxID=286459 RepID=UPI00248512BF|nr:U2 small nuclear ribonucleoprotein auxiliary factor 35 kDa subunit-related protein 2 [Episyrphus balteatus]
MAEENHHKKKHKEWRKQVKKLRRKKIRQKLAEERNKLAAEEESSRLNDPNYLKWLQDQEELENLQREHEEQRRQEQEKLWLRRELVAQKQFREQQKKQEATAAAKEAERQRIQKEFEELQKKSQQRREERKQREEQAKRDHELMMDKIFDYIELGGTIPEELTSNVQSNPNHLECAIFSKTNACRYGIQCKRNHIRPKLSRILFIPNFFSHIRLEHGGTTHAGDINLECPEEDLNNDYKVFFEDVTEELKKFGEILNFRTCMNTQPHLRGNVLVEYSSERDALKAYVQLNGRFYASRQINVEFSGMKAWRSAICGLSLANKCPKGRGCNFLHIFKNPGNLYNIPVNQPAQKVEDSVRSNSQKGTRDGSVMSWNDDRDNRSRRNWRWSDSPEPRSKDDKLENKSRETSKRDREQSNERYRSSERYNRNNRDKRSKSKDRSSSRSLRYDSRQSESSSRSRKDQKRSKSKSPSSSRKHHKGDDRERHHKEDDREKHHKKKKHKSKKE